MLLLVDDGWSALPRALPIEELSGVERYDTTILALTFVVALK